MVVTIHPAISLQRGMKTYPSSTRPALDNVSVRIENGEFVYLTGPSGSGKSTLIKLCLREERLSSGKLRVLGQDVARLTARQVPSLRRRCAVIFQDYRLLPGKTVEGNVEFALDNLGLSERETRMRAHEALEVVGMLHKLKSLPSELSGGEAQRVAIARALSTQPRLLLADEPTGNLDPDSSVAVLDLLRAVNKAHTTVVLATHDASLVNSHPGRVLRLENGNLVGDAVGGYRPAEVASC